MSDPIAHTHAGSVNATDVTTPPIDTTGADLLVLVLAYNTNLPTVSDNHGNVWTERVDAANAANHCRIFTSTPTSVGPGHTFAASAPSSFPTLAVLAFTGMAYTRAASMLSGALATADGECVIAAIGFVSVTPGAMVTDMTGGFTLSDAVTFPSQTCLGIGVGYRSNTTASVVFPNFTMNTPCTIAGAMLVLAPTSIPDPPNPPTSKLIQLLVDGVVVFTLSCGGSVTAPSPAVMLPANLPIVLSGQSNANYLGPSLVSAYAPLAVTVTARNSTPLSWWDDGGAMWPELAAALTRPLTALVWSQGEQDALDGVTEDAYYAHLMAFIGRARAVSQQPNLCIVLVQIRLFQPQGSASVFGAAIRSAQARVAQTPNVLIVNSDDLPSPADDVSGTVHLIFPEGYHIFASRIVNMIRAHE